MVWSNGDKYVGEHKNDKGNGKGIYLWANGDKYVGQIKEDKPHGQEHLLLLLCSKRCF